MLLLTKEEVEAYSVYDVLYTIFKTFLNHNFQCLFQYSIRNPLTHYGIVI
jgi:hypothetical protein